MTKSRHYSVSDIDQMRTEVEYDPTTGQFRHARDKMTGIALHIRIARKGDIAGGLSASGYVMVRVLGRKVLGSRVAYMMVHGPIPQGMFIDHINGNTQDNRIENLRAVLPHENSQNRRTAAITNKTGLLGASWDKYQKAYKAQIRERGKDRPTVLGHFPTPEEAHAAYIAAKRQLHTGCTI